MAAQYGEMVPGESCFSLNFAAPSSVASNGDGANGAGMLPFTSSPSTAASSPAPASSSMLNDPKNRPLLPNGKKTKGRVKIKMEFIDNKLRRYTTFSKRKTGIMKKAYELSTLTGTQVMLLVASETGHVYTFATKKLQPMITSEAGKALIQTCLNTPDTGDGSSPTHDSVGAMSANFHTSEITPTGNGTSGLTTSSNASNETGGGGSSRKKARHSQQSLTFSLNESTPSKNNSKSSSSYYNATSNIGDLPTMVPPTSIFPSASSSAGLPSSDYDDDDDEDEDKDDDMTPSPTSPLVEPLQTNSSQTVASILQSAVSSSSLQQAISPAVESSPLFPFTSFIPATSTSQTQPTFGFIPGIAPHGAFMYQMPQGLVYAALTMPLATMVGKPTTPQPDDG